MLDHVLRHIVNDDDANIVHFEVVNGTDVPVSGVQLRVRIRKGAPDEISVEMTAAESARRRCS